MTNDETATGAPGAGGCLDLLACLAEEQEALERLLFKLREQQMVLTSGEHRWLAAATAEVESAVAELTVIGARRESVAAAVHAAHQVPVGANLTALAERVEDEMACQQLHQRQRTLRDVLDQVRRCSRQNRELLASGLAATNDALALLGTVPTYDSAGGMDRGAGSVLRTFDARV